MSDLLAYATRGASLAAPIGAFPLVALQGAMLVNHLRAPRSGVDVVQMVSELHEPIDVAALRSAWEQVSLRHDVLRTAFRWTDVPAPQQEVYAEAPPPVIELDWSDADAETIRARWTAWLAADRTKGFDLRVPPLQRITVIRIADTEWRMVWTFHHIVMDGRSFSMVLREMFAVYEATVNGTPVTLPTRRPFRDFVEWYTAQDFSNAESFWRERLRGFPAPTPLPAGFPDDTADVSTSAGRGLHERILDAGPTAALEQFAQANGLTMNNIVQGAWALLLARHAGEEDVIFGATRACRKGTIAQADDVIGMFINTLPVRVRVQPDMPVVTWLHELREHWRSLFTMEHTPLQLVHRWSEVSPNAPLFDTQVVFENATLEATLQADGGAMVSRGFQLYGGTNFPLTALVFGGRVLTLQLENARDVIDDATARRLLDHFATILESMATQPSATVGELSMVPVAERNRVVREWNDTAVPYPANATLVSLLAEQVRRTPNTVAVVDEHETLTFAELDARATALARHLRALGVERNVLAAVCAERSVALVVALVAVVKAGGAYVPLDPDYPRERLAFMLEDANPPVVLAHRSVAAAIPATYRGTVLWLDDVAMSEAPDVNAHVALPAPSPDDAAYMIYTSGSTGQPKGALNAHRGIVNRLRWMQDEYQLTNADVVLQKTPFSFDVSVWEFFWPLIAGAKLVMARPGGHRDTRYLAEVIATRQVSVCHFVPSMLRIFVADAAASQCTGLRHVMASGEALSPDLVASFYKTLPQARLHNLYGPTECAVDVTYWPCPSTTAPLRVVPIGRPVANTQMYVLDARLEPCAIGVPGELYIAGVQVGMGYHHRPELTAERFVPDPFSRVPGARMYRTGDRARWRPDGTIEYLGRLDFQVKIRGFRIELGEIEAALVTHPYVREAVVVARDEQGGERRLVAYLVPDTTQPGTPPAITAIRQHLLLALPEFMVPAAFVWLPALPLSSNGKVDRRALPAPELDRHTLSRTFVEPRTPVERTLADIWARVLRIEQVGVEDNFFELGGDSLLCVQIVSLAGSAGIGVTLTEVLRHPTVSALAAIARVTTATAQISQDEAAAPVGLTPIQHWFFETQRGAADYWNQAFLLTVPADVRVDALQAAFSAVTRHHDSLRLRFTRTASGWQQQCVADVASDIIDVADLSSWSLEQCGPALHDACVRVQSGLDLASGPLLRAALFRMPAGERGRLLIAAHHLAIDGVSWRIVLEDLETAYQQHLRGEPIVLPPRTTPFTRWALALNDVAHGDALRDRVRTELPYWEGVGSPASNRVPHDLVAEGDDLARHTDTIVVRLDPGATQQLLQTVPSAYNTQINDALLAALGDAFTPWVGDGDFVVNLEGHGREDVIAGVDLSRTTGWFTTLFPVRLRLGPSDIGTRLREMKELLRAVPQRGFGYGVLRYIDGAETLRAQTTPDVVFNYLGQFDQTMGSASLFAFAQESTGSWYGPNTRRPHLLEINGLVVNGALELRWSYSTRVHRRETIAHVANAYVDALHRLIAHCTAPHAGGYTPSDFPLARLDQVTLDRIAAGRRDIEDIYPLVPLQRLFLGYADPANDPGFEQWRYQLRGPLDVAALHAAWDAVTARHAIFRTAFVSEGIAEPLQVVRREVTLPWTEHDWRDLSPEAQTERLQALLASDRARGFAFDRAPLMRITLIRLADDLYELVWSNHHLLLDRWSWPLVLLEIARLYPALATGARPVLDSVPRYADVVAWQQRQSPRDAEHFWRAHFAGFAPPPRLVPMRVDADVSALDAEEVVVDLTAEETEAVQAFARAHHVAVNTVVSGAWALWLARRGNHNDVSFGMAVAGRDAEAPGIERLIGLTINNLPVRVTVDGATPIGTWLSALQHTQAEVQRFAHVPLDQLQTWSGVPWHTRLFETLLVFQYDDAEDRTRAWLGDLIETTLVHVPTHTAYPLSVMIAGGNALAIRVTFDPRYFDAASARTMADGLRRGLLAMIAQSNATLAVIRDTLPVPIIDTSHVNGGQPYVAPRSATEAVLANLWSDLLGVERVGVMDNFFALGGYSLIATQIVARVRALLQLTVPVRMLFQHPTVASFAKALATQERKAGDLERIAKVVQRVHAMSPDELRRAGAARNTAP